jgi:hypothetical protein
VDLKVGDVVYEITILMAFMKYIENGSRRRKAWLGLCSCGKVVEVIDNHLKRGKTKSCGCHKKLYHTTHGHSAGRRGLDRYSGTLKSLRSAVSRCNYKSNAGYPRYGGRGVTIGKEFYDPERPWGDRYRPQEIERQIGPRPPGHTWDRIDNEKGYVTGNTRWATPKEQSNNKRTRQTNKNCQPTEGTKTQ